MNISIFCQCDVDFLVSEQYEQITGSTYTYEVHTGLLGQIRICGECGKELSSHKYERIKKLLKLRTSKEIVRMYNRGEPIDPEKYKAAQDAITVIEEDLRNL